MRKIELLRFGTGVSSSGNFVTKKHYTAWCDTIHTHYTACCDTIHTHYTVRCDTIHS
jgi:hypothetical protein